MMDAPNTAAPQHWRRCSHVRQVSGALVAQCPVAQCPAAQCPATAPPLRTSVPQVEHERIAPTEGAIVSHAKVTNSTRIRHDRDGAHDGESWPETRASTPPPEATTTGFPGAWVCSRRPTPPAGGPIRPTGNSPAPCDDVLARPHIMQRSIDVPSRQNQTARAARRLPVRVLRHHQRLRVEQHLFTGKNHQDARQRALQRHGASTWWVSSA